jgi:hypothetical protein
VPQRNIKELKGACYHLSNIKKLDLVSRKVYGRIPTIHITRIGDSLEYQLIENKEVKRKVCGYPLKGLPIGWRCVKEAGWGTLHKGYGHCREHEIMAGNPEAVATLWTTLRAMNISPTLEMMFDRALKVEEAGKKGIDADLSYLEISRQMIMRKIELAGDIVPRELSADLTYVSEVIAKVKAIKNKMESANWIPPEQVVVYIMQVLDAVTKGEDAMVVARIAKRASELTNLIVPKVEEAGSGEQIGVYKRTAEINSALIRTEQYVREGKKWSEIEEATGFEPEEPTTRKEPAYTRNHRFLNKKPPVVPKISIPLKKAVNA